MDPVYNQYLVKPTELQHSKSFVQVKWTRIRHSDKEQTQLCLKLKTKTLLQSSPGTTTALLIQG